MDDFITTITCEEFYDDEVCWNCPFYDDCRREIFYE